MILYRASVLDTPADPFAGGALRSDEDAGLLVEDGVITRRAGFATLHAAHPDAVVVDLRDGLLLPGLVDAHVHFPQVRMIGRLGLPLLEWLDRAALPEEIRLGEPDYAREVAGEFVDGLVASGTTTSLVFGSHFAAAVDCLFEEATRVGIRVTAGLVVSDRGLPEPLLTDPARAAAESVDLASRWHGKGHTRYAVTPRFSYSASETLLDSCAEVREQVPGTMFTSHVNENHAEVAEVARLFPDAAHYVDTYDRHGLLGPHAVLAHDVHPLDAELAVLAERGSSVAHCPSSNAALGSGLFDLRRHLVAGVGVALGSDVGAGTGFSLFKEGLQAYFVQRLLGDRGHPLEPAHLLHLATSAGARALGLADVGHLSEGMAFDAICLRPPAGTPLAIGLRHAASADDALGKVFALAGPADVADVWVAGRQLASGGLRSPTGIRPR